MVAVTNETGRAARRRERAAGPAGPAPTSTASCPAVLRRLEERKRRLPQAELAAMAGPGRPAVVRRRARALPACRSSPR